MWDLLAFLLVLSPVQLPVPHHASEDMWKPLKKLALALQVVGPHERWIEDYRSELGYVRRHWRELKNAPPLDDCQVLPAPPVIKECRCFNRNHQRWLEMRRLIMLHQQEEVAEILRETQQLGDLWCLMETATCPNQSWVCRRRALAQLRERLGPEAYYAGTVPPCVPVWHFQLIER